MSWQIKVENLSKMYRLGEVGTGSLTQDLNRFWAKIRGKEDPYSKVALTNDRTQKAKSDFVWALRDINFTVNQGDVLGIVGRNGAGKSTLLKVLSKITSPTEGTITTKGRIASLLEVGTGMHPEMTARENIYLNGAILGMTKKEITSKFHDIVDFSGCAMYIDTPIKRFSSGMRVRLGFAVAAFLEPEILVVDEVLAVGDADFQSKAIGKMKDISKNSGRTVLFVSHNMVAVKSLCKTGILIENGTVKAQDTANNIVDLYLEKASENLTPEINVIDPKFENDQIKFETLTVYPKVPNISEDFEIKFKIKLHNDGLSGLNIAFDLVSSQEVIVFGSGLFAERNTDGYVEATCTIPKNFLNTGVYYLNIYISNESRRNLMSLNEVVSFEIIEDNRDYNYLGKVNGLIRPQLNWKVN
ncbi:MAG: hypothetical protein CMP61_09420 [Flavobacteriales bacterium]|nr:hypothetical protein [Flavobacteriales bacterium]|tara:strand:- start:1981 stop:3222 length:1242 start_codon:yes stop_codon:yes gene_type:complete